MYEDPNSDPNNREDVPFPTQNGPPRYQQPAQHAQQLPQSDYQGQPSQAHRGNGHAAAYAKPPEFLQPQPRGSEPHPQDDLTYRLRMLNVGFQLGAVAVAELWASQLFLFREEYYRRTGQTITDREAYEIITAPLVMSFCD